MKQLFIITLTFKNHDFKKMLINIYDSEITGVLKLYIIYIYVYVYSCICNLHILYNLFILISKLLILILILFYYL